MTKKQYIDLWDISNLCDRELIRLTHEYQMKYDISDTAFWILYTLHDNKDQLTQSEICHCLYAPRQTTNSALKKMEQDGIIEKKSVPRNRKSKYIVLTNKGQALAEQIVVPMKMAEQKVFTLFSREEIETFLRISKQRCEMFRELIGERGEHND